MNALQIFTHNRVFQYILGQATVLPSGETSDLMHKLEQRKISFCSGSAGSRVQRLEAKAALTQESWVSFLDSPAVGSLAMGTASDFQGRRAPDCMYEGKP